mgnify:CR=1 FL=1
MANARCIVLLGSHIGENLHNGQVQTLAEALNKDVSLITVDPRFSVPAGKSKYWLPIKPGTDIALLLAWMNVLIREQLYDRDYVDRYCDGFEELSRHVQPYTPEWAWLETGLEPAQIRETARAMAHAAPATLVHPGRHVTWYGDDTQRSRAIAILVAITGSWGALGGYYIPQKAHIPTIQEAFPQVPAYPEPAERRDAGYPFSYDVNVNGIRQATREGRIKAWVVSGTNLITTLPGRQETLEALQAMGIAAVFTPKDFDLGAILADLTGVMEAKYLRRNAPVAAE